jgi:hypothetical protein
MNWITRAPQTLTPVFPRAAFVCSLNDFPETELRDLSIVHTPTIPVMALDSVDGRSAGYGVDGGALAQFAREQGGKMHERLSPRLSDLVFLIARRNGRVLDSMEQFRSDPEAERANSRMLRERKVARDAKSHSKSRPNARSSIDFFMTSSDYRADDALSAKLQFKALSDSQKKRFTSMAAKAAYQFMLRALETSLIDDLLPDADDSAAS